jgi:hypothetical protein
MPLNTRLLKQGSLQAPALVLGVLMLGCCKASVFEPRSSQEFPMKIRIDVDGEPVIATLDDTTAARDFAKLLPLSLTLTDYARIERIADLPKQLSTQGAPAGITPNAGDLTYYAPWATWRSSSKAAITRTDWCAWAAWNPVCLLYGVPRHCRRGSNASTSDPQ